MKKEDYDNYPFLKYTYIGDYVSDAIKTIIKKSNYICKKIRLNKSTFIDNIETVNSLKSEGFIDYIIDNDLENGNVLYFGSNDNLIGESNYFPQDYNRYFEDVEEKSKKSFIEKVNDMFK